MRKIDRIKRIYKTGGITEVIRKMTFHIIYLVNNRKTKKYIEETEVSYGLSNGAERDYKVIVSLTSFPPRFKNIDLCLKSLLCQTIKPDRIRVYFSNDTVEEDLTTSMRELRKYGVEYVFNSEDNLKSYDKFYYAMREFSDDVIVTADDDVIYAKDWLESLLATHEKYPKAVCARRVHLIKIKDNTVQPYNTWIDQCRRIKKPSKQLIAIGNGGVLYPPKCLPNEVFNKEMIKKICMDADDIWLKFMEILSGTEVVWVKNWEVQPAAITNGENALSTQNVFRNKNDIYIKAVMKQYNIQTNMLIDN